MTLRSMTGFGRAVAAAGDRRLVVEIRSVNGRGFDLKIRMREPDATCETEMGRAIRAAVERGSVLAVVREEGGQGAGVAATRIEETHAALETVRRRLGLPSPVDLATVVDFLRGERTAPPVAGDDLWRALAPAVAAALADLRAMREREGADLGADLGRRIVVLRDLARRIGEAAAAEPARLSARVVERIRALAGEAGVDPQRLAQEAALLADRLDVSEELTRLAAHLAHLESLLAAGGAVGRKIDFLLQEIAREINTTGAKSQHAGIAALVVDAKAELERVREQAQNLE